MSFWVYMLRCNDDSYYTGHTENLEQRIAQHESSTFPACYTFKRRPVELVFVQEHAPVKKRSPPSNRSRVGVERKKKQ